MDELRVPLGASDELASRAERLQTTLGEGPCLTATSLTEPLVVNLAGMAEQWPLFERQIQLETPFRSIASLPLRSALVPAVGALDLYSCGADALNDLPLGEVCSEIGDQIGAMLFEAPSAAFQHGITLPLWLGSDSVSHRMNVWVAIGMLIEYGMVTNADALAALRAYAFGTDSTIDDVAERLTSEKLRPHALLG
jgi:hypothetical protein